MTLPLMSGPVMRGTDRVRQLMALQPSANVAGLPSAVGSAGSGASLVMLQNYYCPQGYYGPCPGGHCGGHGGCV